MAGRLLCRSLFLSIADFYFLTLTFKLVRDYLSVCRVLEFSGGPVTLTHRPGAAGLRSRHGMFSIGCDLGWLLQRARGFQSMKRDVRAGSNLVAAARCFPRRGQIEKAWNVSSHKRFHDGQGSCNDAHVKFSQTPYIRVYYVV